MNFTRDKIVKIDIHPTSNIGTIILENGLVHCDIEPTITALEQAFSGAEVSEYDIVYTIANGYLMAFLTYDNWLEQGHPEIEIGETIDT